MTTYTKQDVQRRIENLIDDLAKALSDEEFIAALEEMENRAQTAREARQEELAGQQ